MHKGPLVPIVLLSAGIVLCVAMKIADEVKETRLVRGEVTRANALGAGWQLIETGNSTNLGELNPEFRAELALIRPDYRFAVLGDEPPPRGDGRACCRLVLSNAHCQVLFLRLGRGAEPGTFRLLSYWRSPEAKGAANRSDSVSAQTNEGPVAAGSGR